MTKIKLVVRATIEETFSDFIISKKTTGLAERTLQSYQSQFGAVAKHMDVKMDIAMLQKADAWKSNKPFNYDTSREQNPGRCCFQLCATHCPNGSVSVPELIKPQKHFQKLFRQAGATFPF